MNTDGENGTPRAVGPGRGNPHSFLSVFICGYLCSSVFLLVFLLVPHRRCMLGTADGVPEVTAGVIIATGTSPCTESGRCIVTFCLPCVSSCRRPVRYVFSSVSVTTPSPLRSALPCRPSTSARVKKPFFSEPCSLLCCLAVQAATVTKLASELLAPPAWQVSSIKNRVPCMPCSAARNVWELSCVLSSSGCES